MEQLDVETPADPPSVNTDDDNIPDDAWWVFVFPTSEGAPAPIPGGRYGYWLKKPKVVEAEDGWTVTSSGTVSEVEAEPSVHIDRVSTVTVYVAQMKHTRNPQLPGVEPGAMTPV